MGMPDESCTTSDQDGRDPSTAGYAEHHFALITVRQLLRLLTRVEKMNES